MAWWYSNKTHTHTQLLSPTKIYEWDTWTWNDICINLHSPNFSHFLIRLLRWIYRQSCASDVVVLAVVVFVCCCSIYLCVSVSSKVIDASECFWGCLENILGTRLFDSCISHNKLISSNQDLGINACFEFFSQLVYNVTAKNCYRTVNFSIYTINVFIVNAWMCWVYICVLCLLWQWMVVSLTQHFHHIYFSFYSV